MKYLAPPLVAIAAVLGGVTPAHALDAAGSSATIAALDALYDAFASDAPPDVAEDETIAALLQAARKATPVACGGRKDDVVVTPTELYWVDLEFAAKAPTITKVMRLRR